MSASVSRAARLRLRARASARTTSMARWSAGEGGARASARTTSMARDGPKIHGRREADLLRGERRAQSAWVTEVGDRWPIAEVGRSASRAVLRAGSTERVAAAVARTQSPGACCVRGPPNRWADRRRTLCRGVVVETPLSLKPRGNITISLRRFGPSPRPLRTSMHDLRPWGEASMCTSGT
eukprot:343910-Prymnesium_polylepis.1